MYNCKSFFPQYIAVYVIKYQHTTCFLLLLCLQLQKLRRFQKRFDAHFCAVTKAVRSVLRRKGAKERWSHREYESEHQSGRGPRLKLGGEKKGNLIPPSLETLPLT